ncbi:hypothetical protein BJX61DRAFT_534286 [Aspergillus egyptiacus]|nr:hypothetical protein BJX61DRAFT_534286 [Aspergillus egyptiacus]
MPALIEASSETRRPRRPSITQQLQRMLHIDRAEDKAKKSSSYDDSSIVDFLTSAAPRPDHPVPPIVNGNGSGDYANTRPSNGHSRHSYSSLGSKVTGLNVSGSRHSSLKSFSLDGQQTANASPLVNGALSNHDTDVTPTGSHSVIQQKDRRATKRLEAERLELEKRLLKLEEAERTGDVSVLRRESRRLTKKQPIRSSSRSSSVSSDESRSRPPSRLSYLFSSSRRRSRSRSCTVDGGDNSFEEACSNYNPNTLPALSSTLPERLSTAISKELAARKNALLGSPDETTQSSEPTGVPAVANGTANQETTQNRDGVASSPIGETSTASEGERNESESPVVKDAQKEADLDRALFTTNLASKKRSIAPSTTAIKTVPLNKQTERNALTGVEHAENNSNLRPSTVPRNFSPTGMLARASTEGTVQRHQKQFNSSPLAESYTVNDDDLSPSSNRPATLAVSAGPNAIKRSRLLSSVEKTIPDGNAPSPPQFSVKPSVAGRKNAQSYMSRIPTSKPSQSAPSGLRTKPRFYNSLNKALDHPSGIQFNPGNTPSRPRPERAPSPSVPPRSPKRMGRAIPQSPESKPVRDNKQRPTSSRSVDPSPESESDYNTADEAASIVSHTSDERVAVFAKAREADNDHTVHKKGVTSNLENDPVVAVPGSKAETKKQPKNARPTGRDQLVAKLFVICCRCKFWHDMPSEVYASLSTSDPLSAALDQELAAWEQNSLSDRLTVPLPSMRSLHESSTKQSQKSGLQQRSLRTRVTAEVPTGPVKCCWCEHHMSKQCCQGWTTVVHMRQRHH